MENRLLKTIIDSRDSFEKVYPYLEADDSYLSEAGKVIVGEVHKFYDRDAEIKRADQEILLASILKKYPTKGELFNHLFSTFPEEVSHPNVLHYLVQQKKEYLGNVIASALVTGKDAEPLMAEYMTLSDTVEEKTSTLYNMVPVEEIIRKGGGQNLIPLYPTILNEKIGGGVPRQGQILIYARPDVGKSTVAMNIAGGACKNGYKVLYCGNEDPTSTMLYRALGRLTGLTKQAIQADTRLAFDTAVRNGYSNFFFKELERNTLSEIKEEIQRVAPDIVIVDQVRLLKVKTESPTMNLEAACIGMRGLAKAFNFVSVLVTQAGESAKGKLVLELEDVEWSNTGVQGQQDLMIGVGQNAEWKSQNRVMLSFPKNKLTEPIKPFDCKIDYVTNTLLARN